MEIGALARRLGENRQIIHHLAKGEVPKRCRLSRRKKLAKALRVPERWLAGSRVALPATSALHAETAWHMSPRVALVTAQLMRRCGVAVKRDLARFRAKRAAGAFTTPPDDEVLSYIAWAVGRLTWPDEWRVALTRPRETERPVPFELRERLKAGTWPGDDPFADIEPMTDDEERAAVGLLNAFTFVLEPWLDGTVTLRYDKLGAIMRAYARGAAILPDSERPDAIVDVVDERRYSPDDPATPFSMIEWPKPHAKTEKGAEHGPRR